MSGGRQEGAGDNKSRLIGYGALGLLVLLVAVAYLSGRPGDGAAGSATPPAAEGSGTTPVPPPTPSAAIPQGSLTETVPPVSPGGREILAILEDVKLSPQASLLAERFMCVCGCKDILSTCSCKETPGSRDMKKYLQELVNEGKSPAEVESAMVARYGQAVLP